MRYIRNYKIFKAQRLAGKGEYEKAKTIVRKLLVHMPNSVAFNTFLADIKLFSNEWDLAEKVYDKSRIILEQEENINKKNKRFLAAYINYRIKAISYRKVGKEFKNASEFAKLINELEADRNIKALFSLPE